MFVTLIPQDIKPAFQNDRHITKVCIAWSLFSPSSPLRPGSLSLLCPRLGTSGVSNTNYFWEKFQTAFDPPSFSENHVAILFQFYAQKALLKVQNLQHKFLD